VVVDFPELKADRRLAKRIAAGDVEVFDAFFKEYFPRLFRFTLTRTNGDADLAEEIVQGTMCKVVRNMGSFRGEASLFTWLCQICRNELVSKYRSRGMDNWDTVPYEDVPEIRAALESIVMNSQEPEKLGASKEIARFVRVTLAYLPSRYSLALEMKYIQGFSVAEIASELDVSYEAAESVLSRARAAFKQGFQSLWDFEPAFLLD
jgi:RNA polymerase sigma-70 factor (ECF subfamily)